MWVQISNRLVKPLKFVLPAYGYGTRGPLALGAAVKMHNFIATTQKSRTQRAYQNGHMLSKAECLEHLPDIENKNISGGAVWYDGQIIDADRLHIELLQDAYRRGLCLANYVQVEEILISSGKAIGVNVVDKFTSKAFDINASMIINAAGPWAYSLLKPSFKNNQYNQQPLSKNFNIVVDSIGKDFAFGVKSKRTSDAVVGSSKRVYFFTPWLNKTVIGTAHFKHDPGETLDTDISEELPEFLSEINEAYPSTNLNMQNIKYVYSGFTPSEQSESNNGSFRAHHTSLIDHAEEDGVDNILSVIGVKYTTARSTAERVVDLVVERLQKNINDLSVAKILPSAYAIEELIDKYSKINDLNLQAIISEDEIDTVYRKNMHEHVNQSVDEEMVSSLEDYILRRNNLGIRGLLRKADIYAIANTLAKKFIWENNEVEMQVANIAKKIDLAS